MFGNVSHPHITSVSFCGIPENNPRLLQQALLSSDEWVFQCMATPLTVWCYMDVAGIVYVRVYSLTFTNLPKSMWAPGGYRCMQRQETTSGIALRSFPGQLNFSVWQLCLPNCLFHFHCWLFGNDVTKEVNPSEEKLQSDCREKKREKLCQRDNQKVQSQPRGSNGR